MFKIIRKQNTDNLSGGTAALPSLSWGADGNTGFYESTADTLQITIGGTATWKIDSTQMGSSTSGRGAILDETPSDTNPDLVPSTSDTDTGLGTSGADAISLIAGGVEGMRITETGGVISDISMNGPVTNQTGINIVCNENTVMCNENKVMFV